MRQIKTSNIFFIALTFLVGVMLTIIPLPEWAIWFRPQWVFAILFFWVLESPTQCGMGTAFFIGLLADFVLGTPIGMHAFIFVLLTYFVMRWRAAIAHFPVIQQAGILLIFTVFNVVIEGIILHLCGHSTHTGFYLLSAITTVLFWPWIYSILNYFRPNAYIL